MDVKIKNQVLTLRFKIREGEAQEAFEVATLLSEHPLFVEHEELWQDIISTIVRLAHARTH